jgi:hypothetical protein
MLVPGQARENSRKIAGDLIDFLTSVRLKNRVHNSSYTTSHLIPEFDFETMIDEWKNKEEDFPEKYRPMIDAFFRRFFAGNYDRLFGQTAGRKRP